MCVSASCHGDRLLVMPVCVLQVGPGFTLPMVKTVKLLHLNLTACESGTPTSLSPQKVIISHLILLALIQCQHGEGIAHRLSFSSCLQGINV